MFTELDRNYTGFLEPDELLFFGSFIMGSRFQKTIDLTFLRALDSGNDNLHVSFGDFVNFCETKIAHMEDTDYLRRTANSFVQVSRRRAELIRESWQASARGVDSFARFATPFAYTVFLMVLFSQDFASLKDIETNIPTQIVLMATPVWPMLVVGVICLTITVRYKVHLMRLQSVANCAEGGGMEVKQSVVSPNQPLAKEPASREPYEAEEEREMMTGELGVDPSRSMYSQYNTQTYTGDSD